MQTKRLSSAASLPRPSTVTADATVGKAKSAEKVGATAKAPKAEAVEVGGRRMGIVADAVRANTTNGTGTGVTSRVAGVTTAGVQTVDGGMTQLKTRADFDKFAHRENKPGASFAPTVKFLIKDADTNHPTVWLIDGDKYDYHWDFNRKGLGNTTSTDPDTDLNNFNNSTYWNDNRKNIAGYLVAHDNFVDATGKKGKFAVEFWDSDTPLPRHIITAMKALTEAVPFAKDKLVFHPQSDVQENIVAKGAAQLKKAGVKTLSTEKLFENVDYSPLNPGEGYGVLRFMDGTAGGAPPSARDVCIFKDPPPNDLSHVAGIITDKPQTPLSHVNLKAAQNDTPNAFVKGAFADPKLRALEGKIVHYKVTPDGYVIEPATQKEQDKFLDKIRPKEEQKLAKVLPRKITAFSDLSAKDAAQFGAKSANIAELRKAGLGAGVVPDGYGIPFSFYADFMKFKGLTDDDGKTKISPHDYAEKMMAEPKFKSDTAYREKRLLAFQEKIKDADVPPELKKQIEAVQKQFPAGTKIRCRSSTNNEDLVGFNGAGLYDSYTHTPKEGSLTKTVKETWSSLWNFRAFEERDFWRIDHMKAAMGVTLHPNTDDEKANGVALTKNPFDANWRGFYINTQVGENLVTNPEDGAVPEEMLVSATGKNMEYMVRRIRESNMSNGKPILSDKQINELVAALEKVHDHFARVYGKDPRDPSFGMDVEWKILENGKLWIKQARPVVT